MGKGTTIDKKRGQICVVFFISGFEGGKTWPFIRIVMLWGSGHAIQEGLLLLFTECLNLWSSFLGHDQTIGP